MNTSVTYHGAQGGGRVSQNIKRYFRLREGPKTITLISDAVPSVPTRANWSGVETGLDKISNLLNVSIYVR